MAQHAQVVVTAASRDEADRIARSAVEARLAACVQVLGPIRSTYRWQGAIEAGEEWMLVMKTRLDLYAELEQTIRRLHSYEVPEILATPVVAGSSDYLAWLDGELRP